MVLSQKIRDLEEDLDVEARAKSEQQKALKKQDRKVKELSAQAEEDRRTIEKHQDTVERQNKKLTQLRRRAEEAVSCLVVVGRRRVKIRAAERVFLELREKFFLGVCDVIIIREIIGQ